MNMLLALDFSSHAREVMNFVKSLQLGPDTKIYLFHVVKPAQLPSPSLLNTTPKVDAVLSRVWGKLRAHAYDSLQQLQNEFAANHMKAYPMIAEGLPGEEIVKAIKTLRIDLVVMGNQGLSNVQRFFLGGVSEYVLTNAACSVLIVRKQFNSHRTDSARDPHVLLAIDGSEHSFTALEQVADFPLPKSSQFSLLHVSNFEEDLDLSPWMNQTIGFHDVPQDVYPFVMHQRNSDKLILEEGECRFSKSGKSVKPILAHGHVARTILETAEKQLTDLIVVGSRGLSGIRKFLLGSISQKLVRYAPCPVLIVRKPSWSHKTKKKFERRTPIEEPIKHHKDREIHDTVVVA